jgi:ferredoxin
VRPKVDPDLCEAHGVCIVLAPAVFSLGSDGVAVIDEEANDPSMNDAVANAIQMCPRSALSATSEEQNS